eukprot:jgi/Botrbrau1/8378/Bobra.0237s0001.1
MVGKRRRRHKSTSPHRRHKSNTHLDDDAFSTKLIQCCGGYMDAAEAGHLQCLQRLSEAGRFLPLASPHRASAGESRKLEVWDAAFASCRADHAHMLSWLFESGWPADFDAVLSWHMGDVVKSRDLIGEGWPVKARGSCTVEDMDRELRTQFVPELDLYRQAMRNPTPACLEALLKAGCRSVWVCCLAAQEQKPAFLTLAAKWGCPCDLTALCLAANLPLLKAVHSEVSLSNGFLSPGTADLSDYAAMCIVRAARAATRRGDAPCLAALLKWFGTAAATSGITRVGGLDCLHVLKRAGCLNLKRAVKGAAKRAQVESLKYLLDLDPNLMRKPLLLWTSECRTGPPEAIMDCMDFLQGAGCQWSGDGEELLCAVSSGVEVLQYCLERVRVCPLGRAMQRASFQGRLDCMQVLYDKGYEQCEDSWFHPAARVIAGSFLGNCQTRLECLRLAVRRSGKPNPQVYGTCVQIPPAFADSWRAVNGGEEFLRHVCELGAVSERTTNYIASMGRVGVLQYVLAKGAPWSTETFEAAIMGCMCSPFWKPPPGDSLGCLQCLHEHARATARTEEWERPSEEAFSGCPYWMETYSPSLEVLQYVCDHMGPTWSDRLLKATAQKLAVQATEVKDGEDTARHVDWEMVQVVLYLARKLKDGLPHPLGELVAARRERAAALAGVFFKAGRMARKRGRSPSRALWDALGRLPSELRERIASQAHLILL